MSASKTKAERATTAADGALRLGIKLPMLIDEIDNEVARAYGAWPDRLYLVRQGGEVAFRGAPGPEIQSRELDDAIESELEIGS